MTSSAPLHTPDRSYILPASLVSAMRFRPLGDVLPGVRHPGANLNGADIRMLMAIWVIYAESSRSDFAFIVRNADLARLYGNANQARIEKAFARLEATEIWIGDRWVPAIRNHVTPPGPGPDRAIQLDGHVAMAIKQQARRVAGVTSLRVSFADLQQLESRYAISIYLKYRAWMTGQVGPQWEHGVHPKRDAISMNVPPEEVPAVFGHEVKMAPSIMSRLFVTAGARPAVAIELQRVRMDMQVFPLISRLREETGPLVYEVNFADFIGQRVKSIAELGKGNSVMRTRPRIPHRKKARA